MYGTFLVREPCDLPENAEVELFVQGPVLTPPTVSDSDEKARILAEMTERMRQNPLPAAAPRFTRDQLQERR
jgi:hypothetical protein